MEHLFSHGGSQVGKQRHNLTFSATLCYLMVLHLWFKAGLIPVDETLEYFHTLRNRRQAYSGDASDENDDVVV